VRRTLPALALAALAACAAPAPTPSDPAVLPTARAIQLARVRCLLVAPFENASDDLRAADAATGALASSIDRDRTLIYPIDDLRALFKGTSLELPDGISPSLALELGEIVGADAVLYGSVDGRSQGAEADLTLTFRLAAVGARDTLFARAVPVQPNADEEIGQAVRRTALEAAAPILERLGVPGRKVCFERQRIDRVRLVAVARQRAPSGAPANASLPAPPPPAPGTAAPAPGPSGASALAAAGAATIATTAAPAAASTLTNREPPQVPIVGSPKIVRSRGARSPRQADWAEKLASRERFVLEDVTFAGRTARFERDSGLADLAAAVVGSPASIRIRLEGFVDASSNPDEDLRISMELARAAGRRLVQLGVPRDRVTWAGRGRDAPILPNFTSRGRTVNRRIEVVVQ
jgi:outer membrane protein OmpA-like peptidoglycan-associated protein